MKNITMKRHLGPEPLGGKRGMELVYAELLDKARPPADIEKVKTPEEFRLPCSDVVYKFDKQRVPCYDAVHRFGKRSGST